jgi:hypothetical protein
MIDGRPCTTRKKATRSAPIFVTRGAWLGAAGTTPLVINYPQRMAWCATGNLLTRSAPTHALRVTCFMRYGCFFSKFKKIIISYVLVAH